VGEERIGVDLDDAEQIAEMVRRFYGAAAQDDLLGPVFNDVAAVDWPEHLATLTAFWSRALLGQEGYAGNPFRQHRLVHDRAPFTHAHFERWLELFDDTLDGWHGPRAGRARELAHEVAPSTPTSWSTAAGSPSAPAEGPVTTAEVPPGCGDLEGPADVHDLVVDFYREVVLDESLAPVFDEVAEVDWAEHIPRLIDYWNGILFGAATRRGSVMAVHRDLHRAAPLTAAHCERWLALWEQCLDARWRGPNVERARRHARTLMAGLARHVFGLGSAGGVGARS